MNLALIDYLDKPHLITSDTVNKAAQVLEDRGFEVRRAPTIEDFELRHGPLTGYECLLYHPGVIEQLGLKDLPEKFPQLKLAISSHDAGSSYNRDGEIPVFGYKSIDDICTYFLKQN